MKLFNFRFLNPIFVRQKSSTMKKAILLFLTCFISVFTVRGQNKELEEILSNCISNYSQSVTLTTAAKLDSFLIHNKEIYLYASEQLAYFPFRDETVEQFYSEIRKQLPEPFSNYKIRINTMGKWLEELIPNYYRSGKRDKNRLYTNLKPTGTPWIKNISRPNKITKGLEGRHIALWHSHGRYYKADRGEWLWQRPRLFCTAEDLFTQSFVLPYLIPMLENAGAIVFNPRERDIQRNEVIVDNDTPSASLYLEVKSRKSRWETAESPGFAQKKRGYQDGENPFLSGTARFAPTEKKKQKTFAEWVPLIPETGSYAVYISYQTLPESITDAKYIVFHKGGATEFKVNQQIGGGTWVYLGTFEFDEGKNDYGMVVLSNESNQKGVVCADAVRFGGGTGNISRGGKTSGFPRYLEGARYAMQWAGFPYPVYGAREGKEDYIDDINTRSRALNYLSGGSLFNPTEKGLGVPLEMSMGLHSDAGFSKNDNLIGTLGIYTTEFNQGKLHAGTDRYASRDLTDLILSQLTADISQTICPGWRRRAMWDRNYSESRLPAVASSITELLSHQNFADMAYGHDPAFKFTASRAIYKAILRFLSTQHGIGYVVQPLPISHFAIRFGSRKNTLELSWKPVSDPLEPTAWPTQYIVYQRLGYGGWDNGTLVSGEKLTVKIDPGLVYSFKVTAVNRGGESFLSEILSAYQSKQERGKVLIVNGFNRISGPEIVNNTQEGGFLLDKDPGVAYLNNISYTGAQTGFNRNKAGIESEGGWGYSGNELEGMVIAGNSFDYPFIHGKAIQASRDYSFVSCSRKAVEDGEVNLVDYPVVDLILGLEREDNHTRLNDKSPYKTFTGPLREKLVAYCRAGGNILVSGSHTGSDQHTEEERSFLKNILKCRFSGVLHNKENNQIYGMGRTVTIPRYPNEKVYPVTTPDKLEPEDGAFPVFVYQPGKESAAVAYQGTYKTFVMGFPFESITSEQERANIMAGILAFFF